jgi:hypothetical protein
MSNEYKFVIVIKDIKDPNSVFGGGTANKYKGAYKKIFDILDEDSIFVQAEVEEEELKGNDFYLYFNSIPDTEKLERISKMPNIEIISQRYGQGGLIAPNGKKSNLNAEQYKLVRTPAFKKWFGDWENDPANASKVVDENGEPLVVYHGTNSDFTKFSLEKVGSSVDYGMWGSGFYFSPLRSFSKYYGSKILKLFLNIRNPFVRNPNIQGSTAQFKSVYGKEASLNLRNEILSYNYDGVFQYESGQKNPLTQIVAFEPNQVKLADGKNTDFDSGNDDIRFVKGGKVKGDCYLVAGQLALEIKNNKIDYKGTPYLVHAEVRHSQIEGLRFGHAFIEDDENVYDFSNNREIIIPKQLYYYFGDINPRDKKKYRKYTFKEARDKMLSTGHYGCWDIEVDYEKGGRTIAQTPAPKKDRVYGSDLNKSSSSKNLSSAKFIKFDDKTLEAIKNKVHEHNQEHPDKKINLSSAKAVVRRGMGAYSKSHRPTISGGKPNSRVAWGLARLNAFTYKIVNGKSKSGKYSQDDDLINELGFKVANYNNGGEMSKDIRCINCGWEWNRKDSELWDMYVCHKCGFDNTTFYTSIPVNNYSRGGKTKTTNPDYLKMFLGK